MTGSKRRRRRRTTRRRGRKRTTTRRKGRRRRRRRRKETNRRRRRGSRCDLKRVLKRDCEQEEKEGLYLRSKTHENARVRAYKTRKL